MNAREELAREVFIADNSGQSREDSLKDWAAYNMAISHTYAHNIADGLIAAGYTKPRTITTVQERDEIPTGAVVRSSAGTIATRYDSGKGVLFGMQLPFPWSSLALPLTVLFEPTA